MRRTQVQLPDELFERARLLADRKEVSLAELVRRGLEYMLAVSPLPEIRSSSWTLPEPRDLQAVDPFSEKDWREQLHRRDLSVADQKGAYRTGAED